MKAIVTVLLGKYDTLKPAPKYKGWHTILFTDNHYPDTKGWTVNKVKSQNPTIDSRYYKWLTHITLPEITTVCYIDASMELHQPPPEVPTWYKHQSRTCVKDEAARIIQLNKSPKQLVNKQLKHYKEDGFKDDFGLYQNGLFVRHHDAQTNNLCECVYALTSTYSHRDQLALPFALFKTNYKLQNVKPGRETKKHIRLWPHTPQLNHKPQKPAEVKQLKNTFKNQPTVHHLTPGRSDLNIGKAINDIVKLLPHDSWICLRDIDTMPAYHEVFYKQIEDIAATTTCGLVSCFTNRLGLWYQLHTGKADTDTNWMNHRIIGKNRYHEHGITVVETNQTVGGVMMLFSKKVWLATGGFKEGHIRINGSFFDWHFSMAVKKSGYKIGIAPGVYLIHLYRPDAKNPRTHTKHLEKN